MANAKKGIRFSDGYDDLNADPVSAGARAYSNFLSGKSTRYLLILVTLTLTITGAVSAILGVGSPIQVFDEVGLDMGGTVTAFNPYHLIGISDYLTNSKRTYTRATSTGTGTYNLSEQFILPFEYPNRQIMASEVRFRENNTAEATRFFYKLNNTSNGLAQLVSGGTAAITNVAVKVSQRHDPDQLVDAPLFRPWFEEKSFPVTTNLAKAELTLTFDQLVRGVTILQLTDKGVVNDIITDFGLWANSTKYIGDTGLVNFQRYAQGSEYDDLGADVFSTNGGKILHIDFAKMKLSKCLNPNQDTNFRLMVNGQPSSASGVNWSKVVVLLHTLERNPKQRASDHMWITRENLPPELNALVA